MSDYQVVARKYRPQIFADVLGQEAVVSTLKNAIKFNRIAHAYLFCGSRGTGKTTFARLFAKVLNCEQLSSEMEPCNACGSCKDIAAGRAIDVMEIDGASHRGIEDIRQINETVGYAASGGRYKIYIIDEVHMLTKEAFNALLKTLEEPPANVKFFFATTEPQKVLPTILSRCQRFNLRRIPEEVIREKLSYIAKDLAVEIEGEALAMIAHVADGGMRDAESMLDQLIAFSEGAITPANVASVLGLMDRDCYFALDAAGKGHDLNAAFSIAQQVFSEGKDITHFVEGLADHVRNLLLMQIAGDRSLFPLLSKEDFEKYQHSATLYTREQCLSLLDELVAAQEKIRFVPSQRIALETLLLRVIRSHQRIPVEALVRKLADLEQKIQGGVAVEQPKEVPVVLEQKPSPVQASVAPVQAQPPKPAPAPKQVAPKAEVKKSPALPAAAVAPSQDREEMIKQQSRYDTLFQFAAVELQGTVQKQTKRKG